jgi:hypothetical protein
MKFATSLNKNFTILAFAFFFGETPAAAPDNEQATGKYIFSCWQRVRCSFSSFHEIQYFSSAMYSKHKEHYNPRVR